MPDTLTTSQALGALETELERLVASARRLHESAEAAGQTSEAAAAAVGAARSATEAADEMAGQVKELEETLAALADRLDSGVTERLNVFGEEVRRVSEAVVLVRAQIEQQNLPAQFSRLDAALSNVVQDAAARQAQLEKAARQSARMLSVFAVVQITLTLAVLAALLLR